MNPAPLLSICIPTFNRLHYLKEALATLLPQAQLHGVEVCVSDNCSTDGTAQFLAELVTVFPFLQYTVQGMNIGLDKNMLAAIEMGKGRYIYPIGDDDILPDGSLLEILREIETECNVLILNGWHTSPSLIPKKMHLTTSVAGCSFKRSDEAFVALWHKMPFGSFLVSRECFLASYFDRFIGTSHAYTGAVWDALADIEKAKGSCQVRCMTQPTVLLRGGEKSWRKDAALIMLYEIPHWFSLIMEKEAFRKIVPAIRSEFLRNQTKFSALVQFRAIGQLEKNDVIKLRKECTPEQVRKLAKIAVMPKGIAQLMVKTLDKLRAIARMAFRR